MSVQAIKLSPKHGVNPTIPICFWCGDERNEVALMGRIGDGRKGEEYGAPHHMVVDYEPCDRCKAAMESGFTVLEVTESPNENSSVEIQDGIYPTGRFVVLTKGAAERIFRGVAEKNTKVFMNSEIFSKMVEKIQ